MQQRRHFYIAPFDASGDLIGIRRWSPDDLSEKWLSFFGNILELQGPAFVGPLPLEPLAHLSLRLTSAEGAALTTFYSHDHLASSAIALTGRNPAAESQLLTMFVESLKTHTLIPGESSAVPFAHAFEAVERPLYIVVTWGDPAIQEMDQSLVVELNTHLAGALLAIGTTA
jgi:hypothetical protein